MRLDELGNLASCCISFSRASKCLSASSGSVGMDAVEVGWMPTVQCRSRQLQSSRTHTEPLSQPQGDPRVLQARARNQHPPDTLLSGPSHDRIEVRWVLVFDPSNMGSARLTAISANLILLVAVEMWRALECGMRIVCTQRRDAEIRLADLYM